MVFFSSSFLSLPFLPAVLSFDKAEELHGRCNAIVKFTVFALSKIRKFVARSFRFCFVSSRAVAPLPSMTGAASASTPAVVPLPSMIYESDSDSSTCTDNNLVYCNDEDETDDETELIGLQFVDSCSAVEIQAWWRKVVLRSKFRQLRRAALVVQRLRRRVLNERAFAAAVDNLSEVFDGLSLEGHADDGNAVKIQAWLRKVTVRSNFLRLRRAALVVQRSRRRVLTQRAVNKLAVVLGRLVISHGKRKIEKVDTEKVSKRRRLF